MKRKGRKMAGKIIAAVLAASMLLTAQGMPVSAESEGAPAVQGVSAGAETAGGDAVDSVGRELPKNPVHHCTKQDDGTDTTDWSYVYFGSYPQTEVTGSALTAAITGAAYDGNGDAWVGGAKYRRISKSDTNYDGYFGDSAYRYFKWERIKWRVLKNDGSTLFVVADKGLDCKDYNDPGGSITWENCTLRSWLNSDFYGTAFSGGEQGAIVPQTVVNEDNPYYNTEGGNNTQDKIFLLSLGEVLKPEYGFCDSYRTYSASRCVKASDYAHARGASVNTSSDYAGNCWWWLRSPGVTALTAAPVNDSGNVHRIGNYVHYGYDACVPALHIDLSSDLWSMAGSDVTDDRISDFQIDSSASAAPGTPVTLSGSLTPPPSSRRSTRSRGRAATPPSRR